MAATAAVRLGLHLPATDANTPRDGHIARNITYRCLMALDVYVASFLGLPCALSGVPLQEDYARHVGEAIPTMTRSVEGADNVASVTIDGFILLRNAMQESYFSGLTPGDSGIYNVPCSTVQKHNERFDTWIQSIPASDFSRLV